MPCWYFERREIKNSPSLRDGIDANTEGRYRREGARFILDAGTKMMLRYDTCATGVVYFHRFYMFHSFKDFYRYVTAACCLFLAGKVEETPKKCKDIIKAAQTLLSPASFQRFGEDPREEVITMERVLLKTIKFDLQVEHPYVYMLKNAKMFKASDKEKTQKMAQMAWTFINDSLCTTLCLQWEPEIISVSLMYLASRLTKFEPSDWSGRTSSRHKWWEDFIEGMTLELMEDVCHQVLDLYSKQKKAVEVDSPIHTPKQADESPPPPPPPDRTPGKRSREVTPNEGEGMSSKLSKHERDGKSASSVKSSVPSVPTGPSSAQTGAPIPVAQHITSHHSGSGSSSSQSASYMEPPVAPDFSSFNPYVSSQMFSASFMSQEGSQNIQSILAGTSGPPPPTHHHPPPVDQHHAYSQHHPPPTDPSGVSSAYLPPSGDMSYSYPPPSSGYPPAPPQTYTAPTAPPPGFEGYPQGMSSSYPPPSYPPPPTSASQPVPSYPPAQSQYGIPPQQYGSYSYPPTVGPPPPREGYPSYNHPPPGPSQQQQQQQQQQGYGNQSRHRGYQKHKQGGGRDRKDIPALTEIKLTSWSSQQ